MELTLKEMETPPTNFAFIKMGSKGRAEQTLKTNQDNVIIFDDVSEADFSAVSQRVCRGLNQFVYSYCQRNSMAAVCQDSLSSFTSLLF